MKRYRKTIWFVGATYGFTLLIHISINLLNPPNKLGYISLTMFLPLIVVIVIEKLVCREELIRNCGIKLKPNFYFLLGLFIPVCMFMLMNLFCLLILPKSAVVTFPSYTSFIRELIIGSTLGALSAFGEEIGWRGFLQKELSFLGFWKSSFLIGLIWGLWHIPQILEGIMYPSHPVTGILVNTILFSLIGVIFSYIRVKSGSVVASSLSHGTLNSIYFSSSLMIVNGVNELVKATAGILSCLFILLIIYTNTRYVAKNSKIKART